MAAAALTSMPEHPHQPRSPGSFNVALPLHSTTRSHMPSFSSPAVGHNSSRRNEIDISYSTLSAASLASPRGDTPTTQSSGTRSSPSRLHKPKNTTLKPSRPQISEEYSHLTSPFPPYNDIPSPTASTRTKTSNATPRVRPYMRKSSTSGSKEDREQGRLDLSKSQSESLISVGLGIHDYSGSIRPAFENGFSSNPRNTHARNLSSSSQISVNSASIGSRPMQPFVHPMRQMPRPFTPSAVASHASSAAGGSDDEAEILNEDDEYTLDHTLSSGSAMPLPSRIHSFTPSEISSIHRPGPPVSSTSQSNISIHSRRSSRSLIRRSRRDTESSRPGVPIADGTLASPDLSSLEKNFPFRTRRSGSTATDDQTRSDRIQAARLAFEEKEAHKDRKMARKRRGTEAKKTASDHSPGTRRGSTASTATAPQGGTQLFPSTTFPILQSSLVAERSMSLTDAAIQPIRGGRRGRDKHDALRSNTYDDLHSITLHSAGSASILPSGLGEKANLHDLGESSRAERKSKCDSPQKSWIRFSAWLHTRMLKCGKT